MRTRTTWVAGVFAAAVSLGCGSGGGAAGEARSGASVSPIPFAPGIVVDCSHPDLALPGDLLQVSIGRVAPGDPYTCDVTYPVAIDGLGNTATIACNAAQDVIESWSVTAGVSVRAAIVRSPDTGTNAYLYDPGVGSDTYLRAPAGPGDDSIARVKLCFGYAPYGCTLTQGYWKTHSSEGPAPYDETWALLGESTPFFDTGLTWLEAIQGTPKGGNAFFILAHQYVAAKLNGLAGASTSAAEDAFDDATDLFEALADGATTIPDADRAEAIALAGVLGDYNEGDLGPGHCR